ncbi:N-acetylmuramoyl-L-alanine amidase [Bacillus sp. D386]|uniref:N-acetylmuramoyl-L-alanine amidase n=1 Tax=Bacillus sp. D386 TaxID=2587155 RepID=UPI001120E801|nr:N-acetylmuramoyl-L-alanine amidase [Bacillus sp. D386]
MLKKILVFLCVTLLLAPMKNSITTAHATIDKIVVNEPSIYVREEANIKASIIDEIQAGSVYDVLEIDEDWIKLKLSDKKTGWVASWLVTGYKEADLTSDSGIVTADGLRVRKGPGTEFKVLGNLPIGTVIHIIEKQDSWISFTYEDHIGWIHSNYIHRHQLQKPSKRIRITASVLNVRASDKPDASIIGTVKKDEEYTVLKKNRKMLKIELPSKKEGWIPSWYTKSESEQNSSLQRNESLMGKTIILDAGHGGTDGGASGPDGTLEKNLTLQTVKLAYEKLRTAGANVVMTRSSDRYVALHARANLANMNTADAFISFHYDSNQNGDKSGIKTYYYYSYQKQLALTIQKYLLQNETPLNDQGVKQDNLHVLRENLRPAVLLELGYINNPAEEALIQTESYQETITDGLVNGLAAYFSDLEI